MKTKWITTAYDLIYALFNVYLGIHGGSYWFISLAAWYLIIGFLKAYLQSGIKEPRKLYRRSGIGIIFLAIVLSGIVCMGIIEKRNPIRHLVVMIAIAAYTFILMIYAIVSAIRASRTKDAGLIVEKNISFVSAIGSMLSLERGMLGTFGETEGLFTLIMESASGMIAFFMILFIGIRLLKRQ